MFHSSQIRTDNSNRGAARRRRASCVRGRLARLPKVLMVALLMCACRGLPGDSVATPLPPTPSPPETTTASPTAQATAIPDDMEPSSDVVITFKLKGGIGGLDETWTVDREGRLRSASGERYEVGPGRVARLVQDIEAAGFFALSESYTDVVCADCFEYTITISHNGQAKTVEAVDASQLPESLKTIVRLLREFIAEAQG